LCRLPHDWHTVGSKSLNQLLQESGYLDDPESVTETLIAQRLADLPEQCDAWIGYSQDRRTNSGWTIQHKNGTYTVQYYPNGSTVLKFTDISAACAAFAMREIKSLARGV
jgi:hypothetical protein